MPRSISAFACFLLTSLAGTFSLNAEAVVLQWYDGLANYQIGQDYACLSDPPILETRVAGYSGYTYWPPYQPSPLPSQRPAVGEVFYVKLVLDHPGNPCSGSAVGIEMLLPAGVAPAVSADYPTFCFARVPPNQVHNDYQLINLGNDFNYGCPQSFNSVGFEGLRVLAPNGGAGGGSWGMFAGSWLELLIPLKSSVAQNGSNQIYFRVNPDIAVVGYTNSYLYVNGDTIFRSPMEDTDLTLDLCSLAPLATGC
jgi:hypothetical protein